ncbi:DUF6542 domain-containing protein [Geodermatophilus sp. URMC 64]
MAADRPARPRGAMPPRPRPADRPRARADYSDESPQYSRPPVPRRPAEPNRPVRASERERYDDERAAARPARRPAPAVEAGGSKLRGILAVLAVFLVTLAAAGAESFLATGLGMITLVALVVSTVIAAFVVRRRDLLSVVVSPPLVFAAVAAVNMIAAPSVQLSGIKAFGLLMVTLLVQGFPTMAVATGAAIVVALIRLAARR